MNEVQSTLQHIPIKSPRDGHEGEQIYTRHWAELAPKYVGLWDVDETVFLQMFSDYGWELGQREATIAASFMQWLGANCGQAFLAEARRMLDAHPHIPENAYLMGWAVENMRRPGINCGRRALEFILSSMETLKANQRPELTARDYEAAECVVRWLASTRGQAFLGSCSEALSLSTQRA